MELDDERGSSLLYRPSKPRQLDTAERRWIECVFCGSFLPVPSANSPYRNCAHDMILDHVRNYTEVLYRPHVCTSCEPEERFGTRWSLENHKICKHSGESVTFQEAEDFSEYHDKLSKVLALVVKMNHIEQKSNAGNNSDVPSLTILEELGNVPGHSLPHSAEEKSVEVVELSSDESDNESSVYQCEEGTSNRKSTDNSASSAANEGAMCRECLEKWPKNAKEVYFTLDEKAEHVKLHSHLEHLGKKEAAQKCFGENLANKLTKHSGS